MNRFSDEIEVAVMRSLARKIGTPYSKLFRTLASGEELLTAVDKWSDHREDSDPVTFRRNYLLHSLLKKWNGFAVPERDERTYAAWYAAEKLCFMTNQRLARVTEFDPLWGRISAIRQLIVDVIGYAPSKGIWSQCRWSNGATFGTRRGASIGLKSSTVKTITASASLYVPWLLQGLVGESADYQIVNGNRACMVPKTAKINRMISIEPSGNSFAQQSIGRFLRSKLKAVGIDLDNQGHNQHAAFCAAADDLATLDLEMASDTLSVECVRLLLPPEWFKLLSALRSERTLIQGKWVYLDKFSSMGNAFNFELETLIFWAICKSCSPEDRVLVYGDDIIVGQQYADEVMKSLTWFGFRINREKSYVTGPFFESCGKHYHTFDDVTPAYQKTPVKTISELIRFHNRLWRWAERTNDWKVVLDACSLLRKAASRMTDKVIGRCPSWSDIAFADNSLHLTRDKHGDFIVEGAYIEETRERHPDAPEDYFYWYKLFDPAYSNVSPRGHVKVAATPFTRYKTRVKVWAASYDANCNLS